MTTRLDSAGDGKWAGETFSIMSGRIRATGCFVVLALLTWTTACHRAATSEDDKPDTSTYRPIATPSTEFDQKLKMIRDGGFRYVWVFKRLDGREFTPEDTEILHANAPKVVDWVGTDDKKTFIAGYIVPGKSVDQFDVENLSDCPELRVLPRHIVDRDAGVLRSALQCLSGRLFAHPGGNGRHP